MEATVTTEEGNRIIAAYEGWKLENLSDEQDDPSMDCWSFTQYQDGMVRDSYNGEEMELLHKDSVLPYDTDWNWLMPIVRKIRNWYNQDTNESDAAFNVIKLGISEDIEVVWKAVVDFIQWYNSQSK